MKYKYLNVLAPVLLIFCYALPASAEFVYIGDGEKIETASPSMEKGTDERRALLPHNQGLDTLGSNGKIKGLAKDAPFDVIKSQLVPDDWTVKCDTCDGLYSWSSNGEDWKDIFTRAFPNHIVEYDDATKTIFMFPSINGKKAWSVKKGEDAKTAIERWRVRNSWNGSVWDVSESFPIMVDYSFTGSFKSAVIGLVQSLNASGKLRLRPVFYSNKVVKIKEVR